MSCFKATQETIYYLLFHKAKLTQDPYKGYDINSVQKRLCTPTLAWIESRGSTGSSVMLILSNEGDTVYT